MGRSFFVQTWYKSGTQMGHNCPPKKAGICDNGGRTGGVPMVYTEQMIALGVKPGDALTIQNSFIGRGDPEGLVAFIRQLEARGPEVSER